MTEISEIARSEQNKKFKHLISASIPSYLQLECCATKQSVDLINAPVYEKLAEHINKEFALAKVPFDFTKTIENLYEGIMGIITTNTQRIFYFKNKVDTDLMQEYHMPTEIENIKIYNNSDALNIIVLTFRYTNVYAN